MKKLEKLDGLRAILILLVFFNHAKYTRINAPLNLGQAAVFYFFILSGFLISMGIVRAMKINQFNFQFIKKYAIKRVFRIFPMYLVVLFFIALLGAYPFTNMELLKNILFLQSDSASDYIQALPFLGFTSKIFTDRTIISQSWTLVIEMRFYVIVLPIVYFLLKNYGIKRFIYKFFGLLVIVNIFRIGTMIYAFKFFEGEMYGIRMPIFYFDLFLAGILVAVALHHEDVNKFMEKHLTLIKILAFTSLIFIVLSDADMSKYWGVKMDLSVNNFRTLLILPSAITGCCVMYLLVNGKTILDRFLEWNPLVFLGKISYSFYVIHNLVILQFNTKSLKGEIAALLVTVVLSTGFYYLVELKFINLGHKLSSKIEVAEKECSQ